MTTLYLRSGLTSPAPNNNGISLPVDGTNNAATWTSFSPATLDTTTAAIASVSFDGTGLSNNQARGALFIFETALATPPTGDFYVRIFIDAILSGSFTGAHVWICRFDSSNVLQQAQILTDSQPGTLSAGIREYTANIASWSAWNSTDRLGVLWGVKSNSTGGPHDLTIALNNGSSLVSCSGIVLGGSGMVVTKMDAYGFDYDNPAPGGAFEHTALEQAGSTVRSGNRNNVNLPLVAGAEDAGYGLVAGLIGGGKAAEDPVGIKFQWSEVSFLDLAPTTFYVHWRFRFAVSATSQILLVLGSGATQQLEIHTTAADKIEVVVSPGSQTFTASVQTLVVGQVYEGEIIISKDSGGFGLRLDRGVVSGIADQSGLTIDGTTCNTVTFANDAIANNYAIDDIVLMWGNGAFIDADFLSYGNYPVRLTTLLPNGNGHYTNWNRYISGAADTSFGSHYQYINETTFDDQLHTLRHPDNLDQHSWTYDAFNESVTDIIACVQRIYVLGSGIDISVPQLRINGTDYTHEEFQDLDLTSSPPPVYGDDAGQWWSNGGMDAYGTLWRLNPDASAPWEVADLASGAVEGCLFARAYGYSVIEDTDSDGDPNFTGNSASWQHLSHASLAVVWREAVIAEELLYGLPLVGVGR